MPTYNTKNSRTYRSWASMVQRCTNANHFYYANYGGRGISVCERWRVFKNFMEDMGERPEETELDRIDNDKNYEPDNCKWSDRKEQSRNRRTSHLVRAFGRAQLLVEWEEETGIPLNVLRKRIVVCGMSPEEAFTTPYVYRPRPNHKGANR